MFVTRLGFAVAIHASHRASRWIGRLSVGLGLLGTLHGGALAATCSANGATEFRPPPLVEFTARDVPVGAGLTPWLPVNGGAPTAEFQCDSNVTISYRMESHASFISERYRESGAEYVVYETGVRGIGVVFLVEYGAGGRGRPMALGFDEVELHSGDSGIGPVGARVMVKYVRTGDIAPGDGTANRHMVIQSRVYEGGGEPLRQDLWVAGTALSVRDRPSCRMRAQEVNMGAISVAAFTGIGSTAGRRSYELALDCEAGVGRVDYQVVPTTPVIDASLGLAEASGGATGVAYQFLLADGTPMRFYGSDEFGHGASSATVLRRTFGVRYQQTAPTITPGPANAGLTFTLTFP
ncbi:fimbrial protein [Stenotrophomonas maltophilia]|uniref:fimbrial protein n=1 Tax=Stenotrophomonas maltophilia TaxID=40324 RepID=UPI0013100588